MQHPRAWRRLILWAALIAPAGILPAQNEVDALRYNSTAPTGTARAIALGGAMSAVGADFTSATLNPAGLALYRRSDVMFTPRIRFTSTDATYLDATQEANRSRFGFANIGYVGASRIQRWDSETRSRHEVERGIKSYAIAIGVNQLANYTRQTQVSAYNPDNSITDYFAALATGTAITTLNGTPGIVGAAWEAWLIDTSALDGRYVGAALGGEMQQDITLRESGRLNEWNIAGSINIDDKFYAGAAVGIQDLKYSAELYHDESDINDVHQSFNNDSTPLQSLSYTDIYDTRGTGINVRLGVIVKPLDWLRAGFSFQSPTITTMSDEYIYVLEGNLDQDPNTYGREAENGTFDYNFSTPFKVTIGLMALYKKFGFISADFDYLDYSATEYRPAASSSYNFRDENESIREVFGSTYNLRLGAEGRAKTLRYRIGYARMGSPLKSEFLNYFDYSTQEVQKLMASRNFLSLGLGIKQESFYLDFAYQREIAQDRKIYYTLQDRAAYSPELIRRLNSDNFYMTIGFTF